MNSPSIDVGANILEEKLGVDGRNTFLGIIDRHHDILSNEDLAEVAIALFSKDHPYLQDVLAFLISYRNCAQPKQHEQVMAELKSFRGDRHEQQ